MQGAYKEKALEFLESHWQSDALASIAAEVSCRLHILKHAQSGSLYLLEKLCVLLKHQRVNG